MGLVHHHQSQQQSSHIYSTVQYGNHGVSAGAPRRSSEGIAYGGSSAGGRPSTGSASGTQLRMVLNNSNSGPTILSGGSRHAAMQRQIHHQSQTQHYQQQQQSQPAGFGNGGGLAANDYGAKRMRLD